MTTILVFILALSVLVFVHEWGHFIVAKKSGVRVDIFSIGFGPKIFGFTWHGTEYRVAPFPFGGYVKIYGQEPLEEAEGDPVKAEEIAKDPQSFHSKPLYKKLAVVFAGPVMNLILCFAVMPLVFMIGRLQPKILDEKPVIIDIMAESPAEKAGLKKGDQLLSLNGYTLNNWKDVVTQVALYPNDQVDLEIERDGQKQKVQAQLVVNEGVKQMAGYLGVEPFEFIGNEPVVDTIRPGSPADKAGFKPGDEIVQIKNQPVKYWTKMTELIQDNGKEAFDVVVKRGDDRVTLSVTPEFNEDNQSWIVGITKKMNKDLFVKKSHGFMDAVALGTQECLKLLDLTFDILGRLFTGNLSVKTLGGPLQIAQATSSAAKSGFGEFLYLLAFLSMQLGIMNLLPIPVLDGGHVVFMLVEGIRRKPLSPKFRSVSMQVGLFMLLGLMLFVTINDVNTIWGFSNIFESLKSIF